MPMVCSRCSTTHEQAMHCPTCGNALTYHAPRKKRMINYAELAKGWQHTDGGRFLIGVGLTQGLFYGLYHLIKSLILAVEGEPLNSEPMQFTELLCVQGVQLFSLVVGSMTAGVARRQAVVLGVYIGVVNSILSLLFGQWPAHALNTYWVYAQPLIQIVVGALSAAASSLIWKPLGVTTLPDTPSGMARKLGVKRPQVLKIFVGPISWFRIILGSTVAIGGCLTASYVLQTLVNLDNKVSLDDTFQESVVLWELKGLALLLGGVLAGAFTASGLKQGLVVGIICGAVLNILLGLRQSNLEIVVLSMGLSFGLSLIGGWLGGQLFPQILVRKRLKGTGPASI